MPNELEIFGVIGDEVTASEIKRQLKQLDPEQPLTVRIHSAGGSVVDGFAIYDALKAWTGKKIASIEAAAFSIASLFPLACDEVEISENGYLMLHNPSMVVEGDASEIESAAVALKQFHSTMLALYVARTGKSEDEMRGILDRETFFDAKTAVAEGYATRIGAKSDRKFTSEATALVKKIPHGIAVALCEPTPTNPTKGSTMSTTGDSTAVATIAQIEAKYPTATAEWKLDCIKKNRTIAQVDEAALADMQTRLGELTAENGRLTAENSELRTKLELLEKEPESKGPTAKAKKIPTGIKPVGTGDNDPQAKWGTSAQAKWSTEIRSAKGKGLSAADAYMAVCNEFPGLREAMIDEVNADRDDE